MEKKVITEEMIKKVVGGGIIGSAQQLIYKGVALDMNKTVAQTCELYPEIKAKLVEEGYYNMAASLKLNVVVVLVGYDTLQALLDANS